ncbi:unnamed protein product [Arctia plantaginis]|uniref:Uncharacterized protein n=1 Tax=Arctia plantaginis TaxID=874455 RepID=A0A8S0Z5S0_ARCPL|nr:unnamed protein product [Arctia plantaginis]
MRRDACIPAEVRELTAGGRRLHTYLPQAPPRGGARRPTHTAQPTKMRFSINCSFRDIEGRDVVMRLVT